MKYGNANWAWCTVVCCYSVWSRQIKQHGSDDLRKCRRSLSVFESWEDVRPKVLYCAMNHDHFYALALLTCLELLLLFLLLQLLLLQLLLELELEFELESEREQLESELDLQLQLFPLLLFLVLLQRLDLWWLWWEELDEWWSLRFWLCVLEQWKYRWRVEHGLVIREWYSNIFKFGERGHFCDLILQA